MKKLAAAAGLIVIILATLLGHRLYTSKHKMNDANSSGFRLSSAAFAPNATIPPKYTCKGDNVSPPLNISGVAENAQSLALIVHDPDAPGGDWVHWTLWNLPPGISQLAEGEHGDAIEGPTSFGKPGYGGPCPPAGTGTHRYMFELYALDTRLNIPPTTERHSLEAAMSGHIVGQTKLTGLVSAD